VVSSFDGRRRRGAAEGIPNRAVYDANFSDGVYYFVMELVDGYTFGDLLRRKGQVSVEDAMTVAEAWPWRFDMRGRSARWSIATSSPTISWWMPMDGEGDRPGPLPVADVGEKLPRTRAAPTRSWGTPALHVARASLRQPKVGLPFRHLFAGATLYHMVTGECLFHGADGRRDDPMHVDGAQAPMCARWHPGRAALRAAFEKMLAKARVIVTATGSWCWPTSIASAKVIRLGLRLLPPLGSSMKRLSTEELAAQQR
jgi:hypothetical protein